MRQWLCDPKILCRKHLLGEHVEIHMFVGHINKGKKVTKFLSNNLLEVESLESRHEELVKEMEARGYKHNSPFQGLLPHNIPNTKIDKLAAINELINRCPECAVRWDLISTIKRATKLVQENSHHKEMLVLTPDWNEINGGKYGHV